MWIFLLIVLAVVVYFVASQASSSNQASKAQASKASSQNYTNLDYSNLEVISLDSSVSAHYNYTHLRDLLAEGKWKEADKETGRLMFAVGYLTAEKKIQDGKWTHAGPDSNRLRMAHLWYFPCKDLCTIDRLWLKYSNGRFGFSVQKRIISELGEDTISFLCKSNNSHQEVLKQNELRRSFERRIGWYTPDSKDSAGIINHRGLKIYNDLTFSMQAPHGHLPTANYWQEGARRRGGGSFETEPLFDCYDLVYLLNRLSSCGIAL